MGFALILPGFVVLPGRWGVLVAARVRGSPEQIVLGRASESFLL